MIVIRARDSLWQQDTTVKMNGDAEKRDIKNHLLFEVATEVANRGGYGSPRPLELIVTDCD